MKRLKLVFAFLLLASASTRAQVNGHVEIDWDYPPELLYTDVCFRVYESTNLSAQNWNCIATLPATNTFVVLNVYPGAHFFRMTASNFWGETDVSNVASTPPAPHNIGNTLTIQKVP